jgi:hypothetical protein
MNNASISPSPGGHATLGSFSRAFLDAHLAREAYR